MFRECTEKITLSDGCQFYSSADLQNTHKHTSCMCLCIVKSLSEITLRFFVLYFEQFKSCLKDISGIIKNDFGQIRNFRNNLLFLFL